VIWVSAEWLVIVACRRRPADRFLAFGRAGRLTAAAHDGRLVAPLQQGIASGPSAWSGGWRVVALLARRRWWDDFAGEGAGAGDHD